MPRWNRRRRSSRRGSITPLVVLLLLAFLLLLVINNDVLNLTLPRVDLPPLPNITIPITGLPEVQIPTAQIPLTLEPGTLVPRIGIAGTPVPAGVIALGPRTREQGCQLNGSLPDPACTPGSVVDQDDAQVCKAGYGGEPAVSREQENAVYAAYNITDPAEGAFKLDHLVPLALGGSSDLSNLWPSPANPRPGYAEKDQVETYLREQVCSGKIPLEDAQRRIARDWVEVWNEMPR